MTVLSRGIDISKMLIYCKSKNSHHDIISQIESCIIVNASMCDIQVRQTDSFRNDCYKPPNQAWSTTIHGP